jgi:hypothetical protein
MHSEPSGIDRGAAGAEASSSVHPRPKLTTAREIRYAVEMALESRRMPPGTRARDYEEKLKRRLHHAWKAAKIRPSIGVIAATATGLAAAQFFGVGEIAIGVAFGYAAYQVLREGVPLSQAIEKAERLIR